MMFADLCCGAGAVTLRLIGGDAVEPPAPMMGGKRRFAPGILDMLGVRGRRPDGLLMVDAGPWGDAWHTLLVERRAADVADALRAMAARPERDGLALFKGLREEPVPRDPVERCAAFLALQHGNAMGRPVLVADGQWLTVGYAHLSDAARARSFGERLRPQRVIHRLQRVAALDWPPVEVIHAPVEQTDLALGDGDVGYLDPPYHGTTGYGDDLPRAALLALATRLAARGVRVGVSEGEPLPLDGWHAVRVPDAGAWQARSFGATSEWLTMSAPPVRRVLRQEALALGGGL